MKIVVGCPIKNRAFVFPAWLKHVRAAFAEIGVQPQFVFEYGESQDETWEMINHLSYHYQAVERLDVDHQRHWNMGRFEEMAFIRNTLLRRVRLLKPDFFLSLDSDILIAPGVLPNLLETYLSHDCAAVGGKLYMQSRYTACPSYAYMVNYAEGLRRPDSEGVILVDVIMAMKLMSPAAYNVDYQADHQGEDVGWSKACHDAGLKLVWDGRIASKHIMRPEMLDEIDERCGY